MVAMHAHRLDDTRPSGARRPHRDGSDGSTVLVVPDQASRVRVRRALRHGVPPFDGEGGVLERSGLNLDPVVRLARFDSFDAQSAWLDLPRQGPAKGRPRLVRRPTLCRQFCSERVTEASNLRRDPRASYLVTGRTPWDYVVAEGKCRSTP